MALKAALWALSFASLEGTGFTSLAGWRRCGHSASTVGCLNWDGLFFACCSRDRRRGGWPFCVAGRRESCGARCQESAIAPAAGAVGLGQSLAGVRALFGGCVRRVDGWAGSLTRFCGCGCLACAVKKRPRHSTNSQVRTVAAQGIPTV